MGLGLLSLALMLLLVAVALFRLARRGRAEVGLPQGRLVYVDSRDWQRPPQPLRAPRYGLVGRPDYLLRRGKAVVPVEAKPERRATEPYDADLLQLAAYCLLVQEEYGVAPPHGLLVYDQRTWEIPFDAGLQRALLDTLAEMRRAGRMDNVERSHDQRARCAGCSMRGHCGEEALL